ncbi:unnamed protein product [Rotaria socialis]|uniref:TIR domain-containing protein n=2 Tax=Rotaria socialis TaxID=392032 RepID=A0A820UAA0_9BILA|nr:unnamed protein product [Rotaria socialis]
MGNQNSIIIFLLVIIWILSNFTTFICATVICLMLKIANPTTATDTTDANIQTDTGVPSQIVYQPLSTNQGALEVSNCDISVEQSSTDESTVENGYHQVGRTSALLQLEHDTANQINDIILKDDTASVYAESTDDDDDNSLSSSNSSVPEIGETTPVTTANTTTTNPIKQNSPFVTENVMKIALSYSSEKRKRVLNIARILKSHVTSPNCPHPVFFDMDFQHEVCRLNGVNHLQSIYRNAHLVVVFLSPSYHKSNYCNSEWRTIIQRFLFDGENRDYTQLLLVKLGDYDMNRLGLVESDFPVNGLRMSNAKIAELISRRSELVEKDLEMKET